MERSIEDKKGLLIAYRHANLILSDKIEELKEKEEISKKNIMKLEKEVEYYKNEKLKYEASFKLRLSKKEEEKVYWKHKHDKKGSWF